MKTLTTCFIVLVSTHLLFSQHQIPSADSNGIYHLLESERGINNQPTKTKLFEFGENNGTKLLAIAACDKCMPAVYSYQEAQSKRLGIPVFFNKMGFYVFGYDEHSFVMVLATSELGKKEWTGFSFINFYSKKEQKTKTLNKETIEKYAIELSKK